MRLAFDTHAYIDVQDFPIVACLERIAKAGYGGIDVAGTPDATSNPRAFTPERRRLIRGTVERLRMHVAAVNAQGDEPAPTPDNKIPNLKDAVDLASDLGAEIVSFSVPVEVPAGKDAWQVVVNSITEATRVGSSRHVALAVDGKSTHWLNKRPDDLEEFFGAVASEDFGVNFDPSLLAIEGGDPVAFVKRFGKRIRHVVLRDFVLLPVEPPKEGKTGEAGATKSEQPPTTASEPTKPVVEYRIPGTGSMKYTPIFQALHDVGYKGALTVVANPGVKFDDAVDLAYEKMSLAMGQVNNEPGK
ncbi:Inosose dehydratase [Planctomycetes bacterium Pan216]|uniref:Inosose dehydratase n=1 Tax=Kolteria novifilia TaxID=2527975 RepID=A0A518B880_9BACT|nr:Inosose dehydratase [Planctomycetes bacterium Pan216]